MDEQKKMGLKRKSKPTEKAVDANEDVAIGALLNLNGKSNFKKSKVLSDDGSDKVKGVMEMASKDAELGVMDDTLAVFRKKLRGSKKNVASAIAIENELSINDVEPPFPSLDGHVKDSELDPNGISRAHKRCMEITNGGSSGDATAMEGLKSKDKVRNKRSKVKPDTKKIVNSVLDDFSDHEISMNDTLKPEKECALESDGEKLEDSLSVFFQKVQSGITGKFHSSSRLKQGKEETQVPGDGLGPDSGTDLESPTGNSKSVLTLVKKSFVPYGNKHEAPSQGSMDSGLICRSLDDCLPEALNCAEEKRTDSNQGISIDVILENSASPHMVEISPTSLRACAVMDIEVGDGKSNPDSIEDQRDSTNETPDTNNIPDRNNESLPCLEPKDLRTSPRDGIENTCDDLKLDSRLDADLASKYSAKVQKEDISGDHDGPFKIIDECCNHHEPLSTQEMENHAPECNQLAMSASKSITDEVLLQKHEIESNKVDIGPEHVSEHSCAPSEGACPPNSDYPSDDEELNGTNSPNLPEHQGSCAEYRGSITYPETKETSLSLGQRAVRNIRKHRRGDMTYEGDIDWEILMQVPEYIVSDQGSDKAKSKFNSSSTGVHSENGKAAAVAVGLKAHAVGPLEKIKFKEVLKLKGGLQEYLECRNHVLSVWNKDVTRILHLADFGMSGAPVVGESAHASLIRDIFTFLDQYGYINFGVPSEKEVGKNIKHEVKLLTEEKFEDNSALPVVDSVDVDSPILGKENNLETCMRKDDSFSEEILAGKFDTEDGLTNLEALEPSAPPVPAGDSGDDIQGIHSLESTPLEVSNGSMFLDSNHSYKNENGIAIPDVQTVLPTPDEAVHGVQTMCYEDRSGILPDTDCSLSQSQHDSGPRKNIIVVGAGPAGLTAARHLQNQGFAVTVIEARNRIGGRVFTDHKSLSVPVDLGASIITGIEADVETERRPDPSSLICAQLGLELSVLNSDCPLYDTVSGQKVPADLDQELEAEYNGLIDDMELLVAEKGERANKMSLEEGLEYGLKRRHMAHSRRGDKENTVGDISNAQESKTERMSPLERRVMDWHFAHLEYGCAALLEDVSLPNWNQDDIYGGFGGAHCMIKGGYSAVVESLAEGICIHLDHVVTDITYLAKDCDTNDKSLKKVKVSTLNGKEFSGDAVLVTVPLGCLKAESIKFSPSLPPWKCLSIKRLGFGVLNKVVLEFPKVFWDDTIDYFGATAEDRDQRGRCFMFWNIKKTVGAPVLVALVVGKAAIDGQGTQSVDNVSHALLVLRKLFGEGKVPDPVATVVTDWGRDPYSYGAYSYVAVGSSGEDYDILGRPVENCLFFAGEATCKEHPDTVGGAMMSGLREAVRIIDIMNTDTDYISEAEAMEAARRHLDIERSEVKDIIKRLDAVESSNALYKKSLDVSRNSSWCSMLKDMFFSAKTTAGRLRLAKELLNLPVGVLKTFASTKGLSTLNTWILDSMGKDGTQLLRHCVRLLLLISNDLAAVRLSGVGKTVKQKVCVHTSRDIRAIAFQLVRVWVEIFRKGKASKGGLKLHRHPNPLVSGKPPLLKGSLSTKRMVGDPVKSEARLSNPHCSTGLKKFVEDDTREIQISEEEKAAFAAAEAASAAAKALAESNARNNASIQAPKIVSFQKFAMRGQHTHMDSRKNWSGATIGRQDCLSEIDSRNCRVRDWSVDFSATGVNPEASKTPVDNRYSNEKIANNYQPNMREHSGESAAVDSSILTKAWVDNAGKIGKDYSAIERWQCQAAAAASSGFSYGTMHVTDEEDSNMSSRKHESSTSQVTNNKGSKSRGADCLKKAVVNYVASLLMPLYSAKKIERDGYKSIMKKAVTKVMDQTRDAEKAMSVSDFLDFKRKNKIRAFVDLLIERHKATKADAKSG